MLRLFIGLTILVFLGMIAPVIIAVLLKGM